MREILQACHDAGAWLIADEAYEDFVYDGEMHHSPAATTTASADLADGVVSIYTFSKSYGLAGWRVGYMSYPHQLQDTMLKVQDTFPTHATLLSQELATRALLQLGSGWVSQQLRSLDKARSELWDAVQPLIDASRAYDRHGCSQATIQPRGAFYYLLPLPKNVTESEALALLAQRHQLLLLPGSAFGAPGTLRLSYGCLGDEDAVKKVKMRLQDAVHELLLLEKT